MTVRISEPEGVREGIPTFADSSGFEILRNYSEYPIVL